LSASEPASYGLACPPAPRRRPPTPVVPAGPRGRGRPATGCNRDDLRKVPKHVRDAIIGGVFRAGTRFRKRGGAALDRSVCDFWVVLELVRCQWTRAKIHATFARSGWNIGVKYRQLGKNGPLYLDRTLA